MATERLTMRKIREILRLKWQLSKSHRDIARSLGGSPSSVTATLKRAGYAGLDWDKVEALSDDELERLLYGTRSPSETSRASRIQHSSDAPRSRPSLDLNTNRNMNLE